MSEGKRRVGRPSKPDGKERKAYQVYCSADEIIVLRKALKLPAESFEKLAGMIEKKLGEK